MLNQKQKQCYNRGVEDFCAGLGREYNPYPDSQDARYYNMGWNKAKDTAIVTSAQDMFSWSKEEKEELIEELHQS